MTRERHLKGSVGNLHDEVTCPSETGAWRATALWPGHGPNHRNTKGPRPDFAPGACVSFHLEKGPRNVKPGRVCWSERSSSEKRHHARCSFAGSVHDVDFLLALRQEYSRHHERRRVEVRGSSMTTCSRLTASRGGVDASSRRSSRRTRRIMASSRRWTQGPRTEQPPIHLHLLAFSTATVEVWDPPHTADEESTNQQISNPSWL